MTESIYKTQVGLKFAHIVCTANRLSLVGYSQHYLAEKTLTSFDHSRHGRFVAANAKLYNHLHSVNIPAIQMNYVFV